MGSENKNGKVPLISKIAYVPPVFIRVSDRTLFFPHLGL